MSHVDALAALGSITTFALLPELARQHQLPVIWYSARSVRSSGLLMSYGPNLQEMFRQQGAGDVDKILRGANPADLPVQQPTVFEFAVNLQTLHALGLTIPPDIAAQVTEWVP